MEIEIKGGEVKVGDMIVVMVEGNTGKPMKDKKIVIEIKKQWEENGIKHYLLEVADIDGSLKQI